MENKGWDNLTFFFFFFLSFFFFFFLSFFFWSEKTPNVLIMNCAAVYLFVNFVNSSCLLTLSLSLSEEEEEDEEEEEELSSEELDF